MDLERFGAVIRPRSSWEAIDLGFAMTRRHFWPMLRAWLLTALPFWALAALLMPEFPLQGMFWLFFIRPLFERLPLFVLSRAIFGVVPGWREVLKAWPRWWWRRGFADLTWARLRFDRSLIAPVALLEGAESGLFRQRLALMRHAHGAPGWLTLFSSLLEVCLFFALLAFADFFNLLEGFDWGFEEAATQAQGLLIYFLALFSASTFQLFYVGAGFALYLNRRIELEGWDVELMFRRMTQRLRAERSGAHRSTLAALLCCALLLPLLGAEAQEEPEEVVDEQEVTLLKEPPAEVRRTIEEVLADPVFGGKVERRSHFWPWLERLFEDKEDKKEDRKLGLWESGLGTLGLVAKVVLYMVIAFVLAWLIIWAWRLAKPVEGAPKSPERLSVAPASADRDQVALPPDLLAAVAEAWRAGRADQALSWLYRGAVAALEERGLLPSRPDFTEADFLARLRAKDRPEAAPFAELAMTWLRHAYAHGTVDDATFERLVAQYRQYFLKPAGPTS
jgi:Domain of unknown function (DUF4129)